MPTRLPDDLALQRLVTARTLAAADRSIEAAALTAIGAFLDAARVAILRELRNVMPSALVASGYQATGPALDAAAAGYNEWQQQLDSTLLPTISAAFGEAFNQVRQTADYSPYRWQQDYLAEVSDRLVIWPAGAMEELRPELLEALSEAESYDQMTERVGRVLGIDAPTRKLRAQIGDVDNAIAEATTPGERRELRAQRRQLWALHDDSLGEWQWKARRIARTEAHGAVVGGKLAAATARSQYTHEPMFKRWLSTDDERVRLSHRVADGQIVKLGESFRVGGALLPYPAAPVVIAPHETIQCRCDVLVLDGDQVQAGLQGPDGSIGNVRPGGVRVGPDDATEADKAIKKLAERTGRPVPPEFRGEDHGQQHRPDPGEPIMLDPEHVDEQPIPDLTQFTDNELTEWLNNANDDDKHHLYDALMSEMNQRIARYDSTGSDEFVDLGDDERPTEVHPDDNPYEQPADDEDDWVPEEREQPDNLWWDDEPEELSAGDKLLAEFEELVANGATDEQMNDILARIDAQEAADKKLADKARAVEAEGQAVFELVAGGMSEEEAIHQVTGKSFDRIRKDEFMLTARNLGYSGSSFEELLGAYHRDLAYDAWAQAEADTNGYMVRSKYEAHLGKHGEVIPGYDPARYWFVGEDEVRKYATEEMLAWFDEHGRMTRSVLREGIMSGNWQTINKGGDYHQ